MKIGKKLVLMGLVLWGGAVDLAKGATAGAQGRAENDFIAKNMQEGIQKIIEEGRINKRTGRFENEQEVIEGVEEDRQEAIRKGYHEAESLYSQVIGYVKKGVVPLLAFMTTEVVRPLDNPLWSPFERQEVSAARNTFQIALKSNIDRLKPLSISDLEELVQKFKQKGRYGTKFKEEGELGHQHLAQMYLQFYQKIQRLEGITEKLREKLASAPMVPKEVQEENIKNELHDEVLRLLKTAELDLHTGYFKNQQELVRVLQEQIAKHVTRNNYYLVVYYDQVIAYMNNGGVDPTFAYVVTEEVRPVEDPAWTESQKREANVLRAHLQKELDVEISKLKPLEMGQLGTMAERMNKKGQYAALHDSEQRKGNNHLAQVYEEFVEKMVNLTSINMALLQKIQFAQTLIRARLVPPATPAELEAHMRRGLAESARVRTAAAMPAPVRPSVRLVEREKSMVSARSFAPEGPLVKAPSREENEIAQLQGYVKNLNGNFRAWQIELGRLSSVAELESKGDRIINEIKEYEKLVVRLIESKRLSQEQRSLVMRFDDSLDAVKSEVEHLVQENKDRLARTRARKEVVSPVQPKRAREEELETKRRASEEEEEFEEGIIEGIPFWENLLKDPRIKTDSLFLQKQLALVEERIWAAQQNGDEYVEGFYRDMIEKLRRIERAQKPAAARAGVRQEGLSRVLSASARQPAVEQMSEQEHMDLARLQSYFEDRGRKWEEWRQQLLSISSREYLSEKGKNINEELTEYMDLADALLKNSNLSKYYVSIKAIKNGLLELKRIIRDIYLEQKNKLTSVSSQPSRESAARPLVKEAGRPVVQRQPERRGGAVSRNWAAFGFYSKPATEKAERLAETMIDQLKALKKEIMAVKTQSEKLAVIRDFEKKHEWSKKQGQEQNEALLEVYLFANSILYNWEQAVQGVVHNFYLGHWNAY